MGDEPAKDGERIASAKRRQDYDESPPRCFTCVYHRHAPRARHVEREVTGRSGKVRVQRFKIKAHPVNMTPHAHGDWEG
jgi:hypothetical protein